MRWRRGPDDAWRVAEWTALDDLRSRATAPIFSEVTERGVRRDCARSATARARARLLGVAPRRGLHAARHGPPRRVGGRRRRRRPRRRVRLAAGRPAQPPVPQQGRRHVRGRDRGRGPRRARSHVAVALRGRRQRRRPGPGPAHAHRADAVRERRQGPCSRAMPDAFRFERPLQGSLTSAAMADYDRDGFLDLYLCAYGYFIGVSEDKAGPPNAVSRRAERLAERAPPQRRPRPVRGRHRQPWGSTRTTTVSASRRRGATTTATAGPTCSSRTTSAARTSTATRPVDGHVRRFKDVAAAAGVEDYGAGMSAAFLDYDNDGRLDIYAGNMWTAAGQRVTAAPGFMPDAPPEMREIYRRHARGNSLFRNRGDGTFEDVTLAAARRVRPLGLVVGRARLRQRRLGGPLRRERHVHARRTASPRSTWTASSGGRWSRSRRSRARPARRTTTGGGRRTGCSSTDGAQAQHERNVLLRNNGRGGFDEISGSGGPGPRPGRPRRSPSSTTTGTAMPTCVLMAPRSSPQLRLFRNDFAARRTPLGRRAPDRDEEQPRRDRRARDRRDRSRPR